MLDLLEQFPKAGFTIWFAILFGESRPSQRVHAECAGKVLRMKFLSHGVHACASNRLRARCAGSTHLLVVMHLAVRQALILKESASESFVAELASKVFWVPL